MSPSHIPLTKDEEAWLKKHPAIRASNETDYPPFDFAVGDKPAGYTIDLLNILAEKIGLHIEYVNGYTWKQLENKFKKNELDLLHTLAKTPEREKFGLYSEPYMRLKSNFAIRINSPDIHDIKQLYGKTVAVGKGWHTEEYLSKHHPEVRLLAVNGMREMLDAVSRGAADATVASGLVIRYHLKKMGLNDLKISGWFKELDRGKSGKYHFMAHHNAPELISMLNKAFANLTPGDIEPLENKWFGSFKETAANDKHIKVNLTKEESEYLNKKGIIKFCTTPNYRPYEWISDQGKHDGISADFLELFEKRLNTKFQLVPTQEWGESLKNIREKKCDILPISMDVASRHDAMNFTKPYIILPIVVVTRIEGQFVNDAEELGNRPIGIIKDSAYTEPLKTKNPYFNAVDVKNAEDGLLKVQKKEIYGYIDSMPAVGYIMQKNAMTALKIAGRLNFDLELCIASRKDEPLLGQILQKASDSLGENEKTEIVGKWISVKYENKLSLRDVIRWIALFGLPAVLIIAFMTYSNRRLKSMQVKLEKSKKAAEAANQAKSRFLTTMSHEIRTPLNAIVGMTHLMSQHALNSERLNDLSVIQTASGQLLDLVNDILDFSKIEAGELSIDPRDFFLPGLLQDIRQLFTVNAETKGLNFEVAEPSADIPKGVYGDDHRLKQMLVNLIGNAIKFTDAGGISLTVTSVSRDIPDSQILLRFTVKDSGKGIAPEAQSRLFKPFSQEDASTTRNYGGTGLGLSIVHRLAEMMDGHVGVESEPGRGSTFWLDLPFTVSGKISENQSGYHTDKLQHVTNDMTIQERQDQRLAGVRLLLVDDSRINLIITRRILEAEGIVVTDCQSGREAIEVLEANPDDYDLVLMDLQMPVMDGVEATRAIYQQLGLTLPVIAFTAGATAEEKKRATDAGMDDFLPKPLDPEQLIYVLRRNMKENRNCPLQSTPQADTRKGSVPDESLSPSADLPKIAGIDPQEVLRILGGNASLFQKLLNLFMDENEGVLEQVQASLNAGDTDTAAKQVHKIRGQAAYIGAMPLRKAANELEEILKSDNPDWDTSFQIFSRRHRELCEAIEASQTTPIESAT
ncbi:transporter substrate-binding domain-containing protein [Desulfobacter curvatus]|uniref:transporter substrate-binding domain-containing protein n=1 Tax=Desulfobacter curvatus TaxID=2290 RepID=UPI00146C3DDF|nr:transporter substrate-binding domain-containing protein [Desulfobacter curvatus]